MVSIIKFAQNYTAPKIVKFLADRSRLFSVDLE